MQRNTHVKIDSGRIFKPFISTSHETLGNDDGKKVLTLVVNQSQLHRSCKLLYFFSSDIRPAEK